MSILIMFAGFVVLLSAHRKQPRRVVKNKLKSSFKFVFRCVLKLILKGAQRGIVALR
jgi:hypothetical protein